MSASITWVIEYMQTATAEINGHTNVVLTAGWRCNGAQTEGSNEYAATNYGEAAFPQPTEGGEFTPYADLTQDQVLAWVWADGVDRAATEARIQASIDVQITPVVIQPSLPWSA
jgi:hypothetical protein